MILKKFLGKTIEAAKKSAQQMYGDDFVVLDSSDTDSSGNAGITIAADTEKSDIHPRENRGEKGQKENRKPENGVSFERTLDRDSEKKSGSTLDALRRYAEKNDPADGKNIGNTVNGQRRENDAEKKYSEKTAFRPSANRQNSSTGNQSLYSRANVRPSVPERKEQVSKQEKKVAPENGTENAGRDEKGLLSKFDNAGPRINRSSTSSTVPSSQPRREQREITALHKRFDKLEALLDSSLISSNLEYASHPAFQQLVNTGISTSVVAGWFSEIIKEGIDPYDQTSMFMSKLSGIIREAIRCETDRKTQKYLLFAGPAGAGKTHLIMKLTQHPDFMKQKNIAIVSMGQPAVSTPYYTILEPFCNDHNIPFYKVNTGVDVAEMQEEWEMYDHVLIDTPSISTQQEHSFRRYWKIRQVFASIKPVEVHYVVNASLNKFYFKESSAVNHPLQPDYIAVTHLDEVSQWGPIIPFMKEMGCPARFVSNGESLPDSLHRFDPAWFAQNVLKN